MVSQQAFIRDQSQNGVRYVTRLGRLISFIHHTNAFRQYCHVRNTVQHCRTAFGQDSDFAGDLEDSNSTSGCVSCIF